MIEEYKKYLKQNTNDIFTAFTFGVSILIFLFVIFGGAATLSLTVKYITNTNQMRVYQENLAIFQKCAEKVTDVSQITSYCGDTPNEPVVTW